MLTSAPRRQGRIPAERACRCCGWCRCRVARGASSLAPRSSSPATRRVRRRRPPSRRWPARGSCAGVLNVGSRRCRSAVSGTSTSPRTAASTTRPTPPACSIDMPSFGTGPVPRPGRLGGRRSGRGMAAAGARRRATTAQPSPGRTGPRAGGHARGAGAAAGRRRFRHDPGAARVCALAFAVADRAAGRSAVPAVPAPRLGGPGPGRCRVDAARRRRGARRGHRWGDGVRRGRPSCATRTPPGSRWLCASSDRATAPLRCAPVRWPGPPTTVAPCSSTCRSSMSRRFPPTTPGPPAGPCALASVPVRVADDGSTWASDSTAGRRQSARRRRPDRSGRRPASAAGARAPAVRVGQRGLDGVAA